MTTPIEKIIDVGLTWETPLEVGEDYKQKPRQNESIGKHVVIFKPTVATIDEEVSGESVYGEWIAWKFLEDKSAYSYTDKEGTEKVGNGKLIYAPYKYLEFENDEGKGGYSWWRKEGFPAKTKVQVIIRCTEKKAGEKDYTYHIDGNDGMHVINEAPDNVPTKQLDNGIKVADTDEDRQDNAFVQHERINLGSNYNNKTMLMCAILGNVKDVLESGIYTQDDIDWLKEEIKEMSFKSGNGESPYLSPEIYDAMFKTVHGTDEEGE
jgi:hypothetical protein